MGRRIGGLSVPKSAPEEVLDKHGLSGYVTVESLVLRTFDIYRDEAPRHLSADKLEDGAVRVRAELGGWIDAQKAKAEKAAKKLGGPPVLEAHEIVKVKGPLFHQVGGAHALQLQKEVGTKYGDFPEGWVTRGDSVWTSMGKPYFDFGDAKQKYGLFELEPRSGWNFVALETLELDESGSNALMKRWKAFFDKKGEGLPKNEFSKELQQHLEGSGLPDHSDFYKRLKIAGYFMPDHKGTPKKSFVFVHPLGGSVRLRRPYIVK